MYELQSPFEKCTKKKATTKVLFCDSLRSSERYVEGIPISCLGLLQTVWQQTFFFNLDAPNFIFR